MGGLRNHLCRLILGLTLVFQAATTSAQSNLSDPLYLFASCTGRLSAMVEHQWLIGDPGSDGTAALRDGMVQLMDAAMAEGQAQQAMAWRLEAKVAAAGLFNRALFSQNPAVAAWSRQRAMTLIEECRALILQGGTA
jgi:hypothetical protein